MTKRLNLGTKKSSMAQQVRDLAKDPLSSRPSSGRAGQKAHYGSSGAIKSKRRSGGKPKSKVKIFTKQEVNKANAKARGITQGLKGQRERTNSSRTAGELKKPRKGLSAKIRASLSRVPLKAIVLSGGGGGGAGRK